MKRKFSELEEVPKGRVHEEGKSAPFFWKLKITLWKDFQHIFGI